MKFSPGDKVIRVRRRLTGKRWLPVVEHGEVMIVYGILAVNGRPKYPETYKIKWRRKATIEVAIMPEELEHERDADGAVERFLQRQSQAKEEPMLTTVVLR